jgi:putative peptidoglycan lipid II flippase
MSRLLKRFGLVAIVNIIAQAMGFLREVALAYHFGATELVDAYLAALTVPNFLYLVLGGAVTTAVIPFLVAQPAGRHRWEQVNALTTRLVVFTGCGILAAGFYPGWVIHLVAPGLPPEAAQLSQTLFLWMVPASLFMILGSLYTGVLNAHERFQVAAVSRLVLNGAVVAFLFLGAAAFGIQSAAYGVLAGAAAFLFLQAQQLYRIGYRYRWRWHHPELSAIFAQTVPILLGGAVMQLYTVIGRFMASGVETGGIAALNYAMLIMQLPQTLLVVTMSTLLFPGLSRYAQAGRLDLLADLMRRGSRLLLLVMMPTAALLWVGAAEVTRILFGYGAFTGSDVQRTAALLAVLALGIPAHALNFYLTRAYYALRKAVVPVSLSLAIVVGLNSLLSLLLKQPLGMNGLALSVTLTAWLNTLLLVAMVSRRLGAVRMRRELLDYGLRLAIASAAACAAYRGVHGLIQTLPLGEGWLHWVELLSGSLAGTVVYGAALFLLAVPEVRELGRRLRRRRDRAEKARG